VTKIIKSNSRGVNVDKITDIDLILPAESMGFILYYLALCFTIADVAVQ
jgi:hypothetical protein